MGENRMGIIDNLGVQYGMSEMPGRRGHMEDAMHVEVFDDVEGSQQQIILMAVCDGHGDNGLVSNFVASNVTGMLKGCMKNSGNNSKDWDIIWYSTCMQLDSKLKDSEITTGGSTGVFVLVTEQEIVVANVGDSRCILIHNEDEKSMLQKDDVVYNSGGEAADAPNISA